MGSNAAASGDQPNRQAGVIDEQAYLAHLRHLVAGAESVAEFVQAAAAARDDDGFAGLFPPATRDEAWRRRDATNRITASGIGDDTYRALFGTD